MVDEITLESILAKEATDLSEAEIAHLNEHATQLTEEQLEKFASVLENNPNTDDDAGNDGKNKDDKT